MKEELYQLIADSKTEQAIQELLIYTVQQGLEELKDEILLQSSKYQKVKKENRLGVIDNESRDITIAKINKSLVEIIKALPEEEKEGLVSTSKITPPQNKNWWQWVLAASVIVGILAGVAKFSGYTLKDFFGSSKTVDSFAVTVLVHGKQGKDDRILSNQGKVVLDFGGTREEESINEQGEATFKELPAGYLGQAAVISIDHPQPYKPTNRDTSYILEKQKSIYLEVELTGIDKVWGKVIDFETELPLDSVRVSYRRTPTYTDEFGEFELEIPSDKQQKFIQLDFFKTGYELETLDSIAPHTQQRIALPLKRKQ